MGESSLEHSGWRGLGIGEGCAQAASFGHRAMEVAWSAAQISAILRHLYLETIGYLSAFSRLIGTPAWGELNFIITIAH